MFWKTILIILGVIVVMKILKELIIKLGNKWEKELFEEAKNKGKEQQEKEQKIKEQQEKFIKDIVKENKDALSKEHLEIIGLLGEKGSLRESIKYIYDEHKKEEGRRSNLNEKELDMNKTIEHITSLNKNYIDQKFEIQQIKFKNKVLNEKITDLNKLVEELKDENLNLKNLQKNTKIQFKENNNELYQNLLQNSSIKKDEILSMFKNNEIYADKDGNAIFPLKDEIGNIITGYKIDLSKNGEPKLCNQENIEKAKILANKVFKSIESIKEKSKELEEDYEQEL